MGVGHNWLQWGLSVRRAWFVFLTNCTSSYIVFGEFFYPLAFVSLAEEMGRV